MLVCEGKDIMKDTHKYLMNPEDWDIFNSIMESTGKMSKSNQNYNRYGAAARMPGNLNRMLAGYLGEYIVHKKTGLPWHLESGSHRYDVGPLQIRTRIFSFPNETCLGIRPATWGEALICTRLPTYRGDWEPNYKGDPEALFTDNGSNIDHPEDPFILVEADKTLNKFEILGGEFGYKLKKIHTFILGYGGPPIYLTSYKKLRSLEEILYEAMSPV